MYMSGFRDIDKMNSDKSSGVPVSHPKVFKKLRYEITKQHYFLCCNQ